jgi:hypothetical protein
MNDNEGPSQLEMALQFCLRGQIILGQPNSGERLLAGEGCIAGSLTPAKPPWSEVMIFSGPPSPAEGCSPEENEPG